MRIGTLTALIVALTCCGCGGGGGTVIQLPPAFVGQWNGTYTSGNTNGTAQLTVAQNGAVTGNFDNQTLNVDGTFAGTMNAAGQFSGTATYNTNPPFASSLSGTFTVNQQNHLVGNIQETYQGQTNGISFDFQR